MTLPVALVYIHLVTSVLLVGYFLFWLIMTVGLERLEPGAEVGPLTGAMLAGGRWPPAVLPWRLRLTLPGLGWAFLLVMVVSGLALLPLGPAYPMNGVLGVKLGLLAALAVTHALLARRPGRGPAALGLTLALAVVIASTLLRR